MAAKITINAERCKSCGLCVAICPKDCITISKESNKNGYFPAVLSKNDCAGCCQCAIVCPEAIIEVCREQMERTPIATVPGKPCAAQRIEEKA